MSVSVMNTNFSQVCLHFKKTKFLRIETKEKFREYKKHKKHLTHVLKKKNSINKCNAHRNTTKNEKPTKNILGQGHGR